MASHIPTGTSVIAEARASIEQHGFAVLENVLDETAIAAVLKRIAAFNAAQSGAITARTEGVVAARNVLELWPDCLDVVRRTTASDLVAAELGPDAGLVRVLYFDKPPWRSWTLPWHKDKSIAVKNNRPDRGPDAGDSKFFSRPTTKRGVPHVEASSEILQQMLTIRLHLDPNRLENGALKVIPGSHRDSEGSSSQGTEFKVIETGAGAALAMRPLLSHASGHTDPECKIHRRTLHFEFAATSQLPDQFQWHDFVLI